MKRKLRLMERILLLRIQENTRTPKRTLFFKAMTRLGDMGAIWILLSLGLLAKKKTRKTGYICTLALVLSPLINDGILKIYSKEKDRSGLLRSFGL